MNAENAFPCNRAISGRCLLNWQGRSHLDRRILGLPIALKRLDRFSCDGLQAQQGSSKDSPGTVVLWNHQIGEKRVTGTYKLDDPSTILTISRRKRSEDNHESIGHTEGLERKGGRYARFAARFATRAELLRSLLNSRRRQGVVFFNGMSDALPAVVRR